MILYYALILAALALLSSVVSLLLSDRIAETGGLSNMGLRSVLSTVQTILPAVQLLVTACMGLGYHIAVLRIVRGEAAEPRTLLDGFRHFGPILRAMILQTLLYAGYAFASMYISTFVFMFTPLADPFYEIMEPIMASSSILTGQLPVDESLILAAGDALMPLMWIWGGIFLLLFVPAYLSYRMTNFCIADTPRRGALYAMHTSKRMLRGNRIALLRLDLSMWWFYALQVVTSVICYGDAILPLLGIELPFSGMFSYFFFYVLALAVQVASEYFLMNRVYATYAAAYEALKPPEPQNHNSIAL